MPRLPQTLCWDGSLSHQLSLKHAEENLPAEAARRAAERHLSHAEAELEDVKKLLETERLINVELSTERSSLERARCEPRLSGSALQPSLAGCDDLSRPTLNRCSFLSASSQPLSRSSQLVPEHIAECERAPSCSASSQTSSTELRSQPGTPRSAIQEQISDQAVVCGSAVEILQLDSFRAQRTPSAIGITRLEAEHFSMATPREEGGTSSIEQPGTSSLENTPRLPGHDLPVNGCDVGLDGNRFVSCDSQLAHLCAMPSAAIPGQICSSAASELRNVALELRTVQSEVEAERSMFDKEKSELEACVCSARAAQSEAEAQLQKIGISLEAARLAHEEEKIRRRMAEDAWRMLEVELRQARTELETERSLLQAANSEQETKLQFAEKAEAQVQLLHTREGGEGRRSTWLNSETQFQQIRPESEEHRLSLLAAKSSAQADNDVSLTAARKTSNDETSGEQRSNQFASPHVEDDLLQSKLFVEQKWQPQEQTKWQPQEQKRREPAQEVRQVVQEQKSRQKMDSPSFQADVMRLFGQSRGRVAAANNSLLSWPREHSAGMASRPPARSPPLTDPAWIWPTSCSGSASIACSPPQRPPRGLAADASAWTWPTSSVGETPQVITQNNDRDHGGLASFLGRHQPPGPRCDGVIKSSSGRSSSVPARIMYHRSVAFARSAHC